MRVEETNDEKWNRDKTYQLQDNVMNRRYEEECSLTDYFSIRYHALFFI